MRGQTGHWQRWFVGMAGALAVLAMMLAVGWTAGRATAALDSSAGCVTPTPSPMPTGTVSGTVTASPTSVPSTATPTLTQIAGRLLYTDVPTTATASPTPLPLCSPIPATPLSTMARPPTVSAGTLPPTVRAPAVSSSAVSTVSSTTVVRPASPVAVTSGAAIAPSGAANVPPTSHVSVSSSSSSSTTSAPPPAAAGLPPPPPPGYQAPDGSTPNTVGSASTTSVIASVGTPVVSVVRGAVAPNAPVSAPPSVGIPNSARSGLPPSIPVTSTRATAPTIIPRAGNPTTDHWLWIELLSGAVCIALGFWMRRTQRIEEIPG